MKTGEIQLFLAVSGTPGTARFTKMARNVIFLLIFTHFFGYETFKAIGKKSKIDSVRDAKTAHSGQEARLPQTGGSPRNNFSNFLNHF